VIATAERRVRMAIELRRTDGGRQLETMLGSRLGLDQMSARTVAAKTASS
jgi:hypothetical protein